MYYKHYCIIDAQNRYKTLVLVINEPDETGELQEKVQYYTLLEGERLIDAAPPVMRPYIGADGFIKPAWNGSAWIESATSEEITEWETEHPAPPPTPPAESERIASLETQMTAAQMALVEAYEAADDQATTIMLAQTEAYETADRQNTDALLALAEVYEFMLALQARVEALEGGEKANG